MVKPIGDRELALIDLYAYWELELEPRSFYSKWDVTYEQMALICSRSPNTVRRWFQLGRYYTPASACDKRHLALMDFLLEHFEEISPQLLEQLCSRYRGSGRLR